MASGLMMRILWLLFGFLTASGVIAQVSRKPEVAASAIQPGGFQATTLLTSVINNADIVLHDVNDYNDQTEMFADIDDLVEMDDDEVLTDTEEDNDDELDDIDVSNPGDLALGSSVGSQVGKGVRARLLRFKQTDCEKKRGTGKGKKMKEGKCHTLHKKHFQSYQFSVGEKKSQRKKNKDDEDDDHDDSTSKACRIIVYHDGKCKEEASTANEGTCEDMEDAEDDDDEGKKLHSRDLVSKPKGPKYRSAKFLCDGVDVSTNSSSTKTVSDHYTVSSSHYSATSRHHSSTSGHYSATPYSSRHIESANATALSSRSSSPSSMNATLSSSPPTRSPSKTLSTESITTDPPDEDDKEDEDNEDPEEDDREGPEEKAEQDEPDDEDHRSNLPHSQSTKTKKHKSRSHKKTKGNKKHPQQTQNTVTPTQPVVVVTSV